MTFTATVKTNNVAVGDISGETVTFYNDAARLGAGTLNSSGQATYTTSSTQLPAATLSITAGYTGDATYAGSTNSPALSQTVNQATVTAALTGTVTKNYNGTTAATLAAGNYTLSGVFGGDTVTLNNPASGTYDNKNVRHRQDGERDRPVDFRGVGHQLHPGEHLGVRNPSARSTRPTSR